MSDMNAFGDPVELQVNAFGDPIDESGDVGARLDQSGSEG